MSSDSFQGVTHFQNDGALEELSMECPAMASELGSQSDETVQTASHNVGINWGVIASGRTHEHGGE